MKKTKINPTVFLEKFLQTKQGQLNIKNIKKANLIKTGILDSMDVIILASEISKKFKIKINLSKEATLKKFENFDKIISLISKK